MNQLIISSKPISSIQIAEATGKLHAHIMRDIRDEIEKLETGGVSYESKFGLVNYTDSKGEKRPCYQLSREGVLQLAARYDAVVRAKLIELAMRQDKPQLPQTFAEALRLAADLEEQKQLLTTENAQQKQIIEHQKPKVLFAESVTASSTSILVADLAKILKSNGIEIGEIRLWQWLRNNGYVIKEKGRSYNMPTQYSMDRKIMEVKEGTYINSKGVSKITKTTLITGKGQIYFVNKFIKAREESLCLNR